MANQETYPASLFPLRGDLLAESGDTAVTVIGIQTVPIDQPVSPTDDQKVATYVDADGRIEWKTGGSLNAAVQINGVGVSADRQMFLNAITDGAAPAWQFDINGTLDGG